VAGVLYPVFGLFSPIVASAPTTLTSVSVIGITLRLRRPGAVAHAARRTSRRPLRHVSVSKRQCE
jgi:hypothetical protein